MYYKNFKGYIIPDKTRGKARDDTYSPPLSERDHYYYWQAIIDEKTCEECLAQHEKIFSRQENPNRYEHNHHNCRCTRISVKGVMAGTATKNGQNGADWWLKHYGRLPDYYITKEELEKLGWQKGKKPSQFAPGKTLTDGIYNNKKKILPQAPGRIWYEADINYTPGRRNLHRIVWSNDGLIFVTYDHYETFYEIF